MVWCAVCRLAVARERHSMAVDQAGRLLIMGGKKLSMLGGDLSVIERVDPARGTSVKAGHLVHTGGTRQCILVLEGRDTLLHVGGWVPDQGHSVQVYDCRTGAVVTTAVLPRHPTKGGPVYGTVLAKDHLFIVSKHHTAVLSLDDALKGQGHRATYCKNYLTPNFVCAVVCSADGSNLLLLGGRPRSGQPKCYAYQARVEDVRSDRACGWQPAGIAWTLGECMFHGGYDVASITRLSQGPNGRI